MRRISLVILITAAVLTAVASCAKRGSEDTDKMEEMAFEAWIQKKAADEGLEVQKQPNGMYVQFLADGDQSIDYAPSDTIVWLRLNYTATDLYDNVFVTRNEGDALNQRTFTPYTYYVPDYAFCGDQNSTMISGQYYALKNKLVKPDGSTIKMSVGTHVRLFLPSYLAFGTNGYTDDQGYGGQYELSGRKPVIDDIEIVEVIKNPVSREEKLVNNYALNEWGFAEADTLVTYLFLDTLNFRTDLKKPYKKEYKITADTTAKVWFVGKFLDNETYKEFIFDTNIDSVYNRFYNRKALNGYYADSKTLSVFNYKPNEDKSDYISAFYEVIPKIRKGQWCRIVFTSAYGYGATGLNAAIKAQTDYYNSYMDYVYNSYYSTSNNYYSEYYGTNYAAYNYLNYSTSSSEDEDEITTEIQPYTPLIFEIYVATEEDSE